MENEQRPTTLWVASEEKQLADLGANVIDGPLVEDENKVTSTSPATAIDVALTLVARLTSQENSDRIQELMGFVGHSANSK